MSWRRKEIDPSTKEREEWRKVYTLVYTFSAKTARKCTLSGGM
jgi:hypothetical protein